MPGTVGIVLDTNVVLDWLVFRDQGAAHLVAAIEQARVTLWTNAACDQELERVLGYAQFGLSHADQAAMLAHYRAWARRPEGTRAGLALPRCKDPDDQKFLELARDARADWLITKDKYLLELARAKYRLRGIRIGVPMAFSVPSLSR